MVETPLIGTLEVMKRTVMASERETLAEISAAQANPLMHQLHSEGLIGGAAVNSEGFHLFYARSLTVSLHSLSLYGKTQEV